MTLAEWKQRELDRLKLEVQEGFSYGFKFGQITTSPTSYSAEGQIDSPASGVVTTIFRVHETSGIKELVMPAKMLDIPHQLEEKSALVDIYQTQIIDEQGKAKEALAKLETAETELAELKATNAELIAIVEAL
jgi:hypothetical protein